MTTLQTGNLASTSYGYDGRGRLASVTVGTGNTARATAFGYDELDRLTTVTDPLSRTEGYAYDDANRMVAQTFADQSTVVLWKRRGSHSSQTRSRILWS